MASRRTRRTMVNSKRKYTVLDMDGRKYPTKPVQGPMLQHDDRLC